MIDTLYVNGDSWSFGCGLKEDYRVLSLAQQDGKNIPGDEHHYAWPRWLAEELGIKTVVNDSVGGGSNARILRMTVSKISKMTADECKKTLVVLGFTHIDRSEIFLVNDPPYRTGWFRFNYNQPFWAYYEPENGDEPRELPRERIRAIDKYRELHVTEAYEEQGALESFYNQVYLLKNLMENLEIPFVFFTSIGIVNFPKAPPVIASLVRKWEERIACPNIVDMRISMQGCMDEWNHQLTSCIHPMLDGHKAWASYIARLIRDGNILGASK